MTNRTDLESEYVNLYRQAWGTNSGLDSERIKNMTPEHLTQCIRSLTEFVKKTQEQRARKEPSVRAIHDKRVKDLEDYEEKEKQRHRDILWRFREA